MGEFPLKSQLERLATKIHDNYTRNTDLFANGKVKLSLLPDVVMGQMFFGGLVSGSGVVTLSANAREKYSIDSLTITSTNAGQYEGMYLIASANGTSGVPKELDVITGDWVVSTGSDWSKVDNTDAVASVAGLTGVITTANLQSALGLGSLAYKSSLAAADIPALDASKITSGTFADARIASASKWNAKYDKPSGGIPKSDLASAVQTSLDKADNALPKATFDDLFEKVTVNGVQAIKAKYGFFSVSFVSAQGAETEGGGGGTTDLASVWASLGSNTDSYANYKINSAHIPALPISQITGLQVALGSKADVSALGSLAYKNSLTSDDIPTLAISKISGLQTALDGKQDASTAINTSNIGSQSVAYATHSGYVDMVSNITKSSAIVESGLRVYSGSGGNWADSANPTMAYAAILAIGNPLRGFQIWAAREGDDIGLRWRKGIQNATSWGATHLIYDDSNIGSASVAYANTAGSAPASDVYSWAKAATKPSYAFSEITNKPTTISGYGITDAITTGNIGSQSVAYASNSGALGGYTRSAFEGYYEYVIDTTTLDDNTWYPVTIQLEMCKRMRIKIQGRTSAPASWNSREDKAMALNLEYVVSGQAWGWIPVSRYVLCYEEGAGANKCLRGLGQMTNSSIEYIYVRGGAKYNFYLSRAVVPTLRTSTYTVSGQSVSPTITEPSPISLYWGGHVDWSNVNSRPTALSSFTDDVVSGHYLPLSGGSLSNTSFASQLTINRQAISGDSVIKYAVNGSAVGYMGFHSDGTPCVYGTDTSGNGYTIYHSGNSNKSDVDWSCQQLSASSVAIRMKIQDWNISGAYTNRIDFLRSGSSAQEHSPGAYWNGVSIMMGYVGFQLAVYGTGATDLKYRKISDAGVWSGWENIYHSGTANKTDVAWSASSLTLNGAITGATTISTSNRINCVGLTVHRISNYSAGSNTQLHIDNYDTLVRINAVDPDDNWCKLVFQCQNIEVLSLNPEDITAQKSLSVSGNILATGAITAGSASDARLKSNVVSLPNAIQILKSLRGVAFDWNATANENCKDLNGHDVGMIAQEVEPYIPSAIGSIFSEYKRLDYTKITPYLVEGWKSHDDEIERLKARVKELEAQVEQMKFVY